VVLSLNAGGTERLVIELARRLCNVIPMAICCLDDQGDWASELKASGVMVQAIRRRPGFDIHAGRELRRIAQDHRATIMHCHHYSPFVYGSVARMWGSACRIVFTEHGRLSDAPPSLKRRAANFVLSRFADRVFAVSAELRQHLIEEGFRPRAVDVIYNGVDVGVGARGAPRRIRQELGISPDALVVGSVGRLDPVKDLRTLVFATAQLRRSHPTELVIIGDGPERAHLEAAAAERGLERAVHFLGYRSDAREWLAGCDVYVNSSVSEGVSLTILEAMTAGLPVIATSVGGTPEILDSTCGMLVPPRDPQAIADALLQLAREPQRRVQLGRAARRRVEERFTLDRMIQQYSDVYRMVA
jgi:glycosyltransferase involved in cell wall biosynthesis